MGYIELAVRRQWIEQAIIWACRRERHTIDRPGMNLRGPVERFDDIVMGEIASAAVMQYLVDRRNHVVAYDDIRIDDFVDPDPGWDLVVGKGLTSWPAQGDDVTTPPADTVTISVKSSRIPDADSDSIHKAIGRRDFKILKENEEIEADLTADFESQVYYRLQQSKLRDELCIGEEDLRNEDATAILEGLDLVGRYGVCYLVGFVAKDVLVQHSRSLQPDDRTWVSSHQQSMKRMWKAPLTLARLPV